MKKHYNKIIRGAKLPPKGNNIRGVWSLILGQWKVGDSIIIHARERSSLKVAAFRNGQVAMTRYHSPGKLQVWRTK
jgi:hypothetical protein